MITKHDVSEHCAGEVCQCGEPATHKIAEEIQIAWPPRHELVAYVCCRHFNMAVRAYLPSGHDAECDLP